MCWTIRVGGMSSGSLLRISVKACGPPVEAPIAITLSSASKLFATVLGFIVLCVRGLVRAAVLIFAIS